MFGEPGRAYVYLVYGMYDCLNVVTEAEGRPAALLIRAVEPIEGVEQMRAARLEWAGNRRSATAATQARLRALPVERLASGPGLVTVAFGIGRGDTGRDLCDPKSSLRLEEATAGDRPVAVAATPRIGIDYAAPPWREHPWRLLDAAAFP